MGGFVNTRVLLVSILTSLLVPLPPGYGRPVRCQDRPSRPVPTLSVVSVQGCAVSCDTLLSDFKGERLQGYSTLCNSGCFPEPREVMREWLEGSAGTAGRGPGGGVLLCK